MTLEETISKCKTHDIHYNATLIAGKQMNIVLKRYSNEPKVSNVFKHDEFEMIVPWIKDAAFNCYVIDLE